MAIDCYMMDTETFIMQFPVGFSCDISIEGSVDGTNYIDTGVIIQPVDGVATATRFASLSENAISFLRVSLSNVVGSGLVKIQAQAKGLS
jgi:hypothetical protein